MKGVYIRVVLKPCLTAETMGESWSRGWLVDFKHRTVDRHEGCCPDRKKLFTDKCELDKAVELWTSHGWLVTLVPEETR